MSRWHVRQTGKYQIIPIPVHSRTYNHGLTIRRYLICIRCRIVRRKFYRFYPYSVYNRIRLIWNRHIGLIRINLVLLRWQPLLVLYSHEPSSRRYLILLRLLTPRYRCINTPEFHRYQRYLSSHHW